MSILLEVVIGTVLSFLVTTGEIQKDIPSKKEKTEQVSEVSVAEYCDEKHV